MANDTQRKVIFDWLTTACLEQHQMGKVGGGIVLVEVVDSAVKTELRTFDVSPLEEGAATTVASALTDQIVGEAEANCEGKRLRRATYMLRAMKNGVRKAIATRNFNVEVEFSEEEEPSAAVPSFDTTMGVMTQAIKMLQETRQQNAEMHKAMLEMTRCLSQGLPQIITAQASMLTAHQGMQADNMALLQANIVNREGREAAAFAKLQQAKDWQEFKNMVLPVLLPHVMQAIAASNADTSTDPA